MIEGHLRNLPLTDLLQLVSSGRKDGVLHLERSSASARLLFRDGRLADAVMEPGPHLAEVLVRFELLPFQAALDLASSSDGDSFAGRLPGMAGRLGRDEIAQAVDAYLLDVVAQLVEWRSGTFSFRETDGWTPFEDSRGIEVASALLQVGGELEKAQGDRVLKTAVDPTKVTLPPYAWEILHLVDGRRTVEMVAAQTPLPEWQTARTLARLEEVGVVEPVSFSVEVPQVLVVVAGNQLARLVRQLLLRLGVQPVLVDTAAAAVAILGRDHFRAAIVDEDLPDFTSIVGPELRRSPSRSLVPVIQLQGRVDNSLLGRLRRSRTITLEKPFSESQFTALLSKMVLPRAI